MEPRLMQGWESELGWDSFDCKSKPVVAMEREARLKEERRDEASQQNPRKYERNPTSNQDSETSSKSCQNQFKSNPKMTPQWSQKWSQNGPWRPPDNEKQGEIEIDDFRVILELQNGAQKYP